MNLMICMRGNPDQHEFLPEITEIGAGIELGSYGLVGIQSEQNWKDRLSMHKSTCDKFNGPVAIHGPFIGIEFAHDDHLIRDAVQRRLDMTFEAAIELKAGRVILHSGYRHEYDLFKLRNRWRERQVEFWKQEIRRWAESGITIAIENNAETMPDLLVSLADGVDHTSLGLCFDIGHQHVFSDLDASEWVRRMGKRLIHVHLHDNDGTADRHLPMGEGTIDFESFFETIREYPDVTLSVEVEADMPVKMDNLRKLSSRLNI